RNYRTPDQRPRRRHLDRRDAPDVHARPARRAADHGLWRAQRLRPHLWLERTAYAQGTLGIRRTLAAASQHRRVVHVARARAAVNVVARASRPCVSIHTGGTPVPLKTAPPTSISPPSSANPDRVSAGPKSDIAPWPALPCDSPFPHPIPRRSLHSPDGSWKFSSRRSHCLASMSPSSECRPEVFSRRREVLPAS